MKLILDAGNSRLKWQLRAVTHSVLEAGACEYAELESLFPAWVERGVTEILVSSVKGVEFERYLDERSRFYFGLPPVFARVIKERCGLIAGYQDLSALGVDRWLAMLAAYVDCNSALVVIDAGTAITVDFVGVGGLHEGGLIVPGQRTLTRSLFVNTSAVRVESLTLPQTWLPGCDTLSCVEQGVAASYKGLMREVVLRASRERDGVGATIYLAGGDANLFRQWLPADVKCRPDLVFEGLLLSC
ncbi:type III pantothenate kinase [Teredinibacter franksiae]|uniref:type III pantothenate kinase n=1 Tax=Teredinibacter franksiae TaxID=2761453 RepID=UPI00162923D1|nr:type III pantothenate kinase [Teredinibacter franksiae]